MTYSSKMEDALLYAARIHRAQVRKSTGVPYLGHLLGVTSTVIDNGGTENEACAAVLHDAIEDQGGDSVRQDIKNLFGDEIERIVSACSDTDIQPKPPWKDRKVVHLNHMKTADDSVRLVVIADKLHNLRELMRQYQKITELRASEQDKARIAIWEPFKGGRNGTVWYYTCMARVLLRANESPSPLRDLSWTLNKEANKFYNVVYLSEPDLKIDDMP